jgi:nitrite reductase/ring-hydroxylating ferredoxin subunit
VVSTRALVADLLGYDPELPQRPTVAEAAAACRPGEVIAAREGTAEVAVVRLVDGRAFVVDDACPHDGGPLSSGWVDGDRLVCARHNWEIDPATGRCDRRGACVESRALLPALSLVRVAT